MRPRFLDDRSLEVYLGPFWVAWDGRQGRTGRSYDKTNPAWLTEWALNDRIPPPSGPGVASPNTEPKSLGAVRRAAERHGVELDGS